MIRMRMGMIGMRMGMMRMRMGMIANGLVSEGLLYNEKKN